MKQKSREGGNSRPLMFFDQEPLRDRDNVRLTHQNMLPTPHVGYVTEDEFDLQFSDIFDQLKAYAAGTPIQKINP